MAIIILKYAGITFNSFLQEDKVIMRKYMRLIMLSYGKKIFFSYIEKNVTDRAKYDYHYLGQMLK